MSWYDEEESKSYNEDGSLTPYGLAVWFDDEGGPFGFIQGRGIESLVEAGVNPTIARNCQLAMDALQDELERIGAVL